MRKEYLLFVLLLFGIFALFSLHFSRSTSSDDYIPTPVTGVEMDCFHENSPVSWSYCINKESGSENQDVLYYLHARNGNETWWNDRNYHTGRLYEHWRQNNQSAPIVVTVSFGEVWVLKEDQEDPNGGLYRIFTSIVIPTIEKKLEQTSGKRLIAGISMGGYNTLIVSMKSKGFFDKAASICAPLPMVSHHNGLWRILTQVRESGASFGRTIFLWQFSRRYYPKKDTWLANDPLTLSTSFTPKNAPAMYVTCGENDDWGCFEGAERFVENIRAAGGEIEWIPREGGHCDIEYASLANFLQNDWQEQR